MDLQTLNRIKKTILEIKLTLIGEEGLDNIENLLTLAMVNGVKGAFVEAGVWRGGACIWARALMDFLSIDEDVYVCDSFEGLPRPSMVQDTGDQHYLIKELSVSENTVKENFSYFPLMGPVKFIKGFFKDTMPKLKDEIDVISILRIDGDMYESTMQVLENLYDKVSVGGYIIADDYGLPGAKIAIDEFRENYNIKNPIIRINNCIHYWQK